MKNFKTLHSKSSLVFCKGYVDGVKGTFFDNSYINTYKGLVIYNPAVGGWSKREGGQKIFRTCLRGGENFLYFS